MILHASGFVRADRPTSVQVATYDGALTDTANGVLNAIKAHGHQVEVHTVRTLNGWLREVHAFVDVDGTEMWHVFTEPSAAWPTYGPIRGTEVSEITG